MQSPTSLVPQSDADIHRSMPPLGEGSPATYYGRLLYFVWEDEALRSDVLDKLPTLQECQNMFLEAKYAYILRAAVICHERREGDYSRLRSIVQQDLLCINVSDNAAVEEFQKSVKAFLDEIDPAILELVNGKVGLPLWKPPSDMNADYLAHVRDLKVPCLTARKDTPDLLLHELGALVEQPEARACIDQIFRDQITYLCNAAGSGKTRLLLEGLTLHWGLFFTLERDDWSIGSNDFCTALARLPDEQGFTESVHHSEPTDDPDDPMNGVSEDRFRGNSEIVGRRVRAVLLARLLIFQRFFKHVPETMTEKEEAVYRLRWLTLQVDPCILPKKHFDVFLHLTRMILNKSFSNVAVRTAVGARLQQLIDELFPAREAPAPSTAPPTCPTPAPRFSRFYVVLDEAQNVATLYPKAFRTSGKPKETANKGNANKGAAYRPLLREILFVIMEPMRNRRFYAIPTGTSISSEDFLHAIQSHIAKDRSQIVARYTGGVHSPQDAEKFAKRMLPGTYLAGKSGRRLQERMFTWLRGRFRVMARFLAYLLSDGLKSPHQMLNSFVYAYTNGYEPSDAQDLVAHEPKLPVSYVRCTSTEQINFEGLIKDAYKTLEIVRTVRPLVSHFLVKSAHKTIVPPAESPLLVSLGFARYTTPDIPSATSPDPAFAVIDEPIMILRLVTWFETETRGRHTLYEFFADELENNTADDNGWENYMIYSLIQLFSREPAFRLRDIFDVVKTPAGDFAELLDKTAEIVRVIRPDGSTLDPDESLPRIAVLNDGRHINTSYTANELHHPRIPGVHLGDTVRNPPSAKSSRDRLDRAFQHTLRWLSHTTTPIFRPDTNLGPDLIIILRLEDGHLCWLVVQCKLVSPTGSAFKVRSGDLESAFLSTQPENFFISANRKERNAREYEKNSSALESLEKLPNRTKLAGKYSCIRAIAIFPGDCDGLRTHAATDHNSHPLVKLNFTCLKNAMGKLYPKNKLAEYEDKKKEKAKNDAAIKAAAEAEARKRRKRASKKKKDEEKDNEKDEDKDEEEEDEDKDEEEEDEDEEDEEPHEPISHPVRLSIGRGFMTGVGSVPSPSASSPRSGNRNQSVLDADNMEIDDSASAVYGTASAAEAPSESAYTAGSDYTIDDADAVLYQHSYNFPSAAHPADTPGAGPSWAPAGLPMAPQQSAHPYGTGAPTTSAPSQIRSTRSKRPAATMSEDGDDARSSVGSAPKRRRQH